MSTRYVRECDCGWTSDACVTATDAARLGKRHGCAQTEDNWLMLAAVVVRQMRVSGDNWQEAVQETALAGWLAAERWTPDGGMSRRNWIWQAMERGLVDWLRLRLGRHGQRAAWEQSWQYLDEPIVENLTLGAILQDPTDPYAVVERTVDLDRMISNARLDPREQQWLTVFLADEPQKILMDEWDVSESRVSQVKGGVLAKLHAVTCAPNHTPRA